MCTNSLLFSQEQFQKEITSALSAWDSLGKDHLLSHLLLTKEIEDAAMQEGRYPLPRLCTNLVLQNGIEKLDKNHAKAADILRERFVIKKKTRALAVKLNVSADQLNRMQRKAIEQLSNILWQEEYHARKEYVHALESQLPPPQASRLFGFDEARTQIVTQLQLPDSKWIVAVVGIGGIGKTSLARAAVTSLIHQFRFEKYVWVRIDPAPFEKGETFELSFDALLLELAQLICPDVPASAPTKQREQKLRQTLKETAHLVVIDNLETEARTGYLLEQLMGWTNPSKFLLTTRSRPTGVEEVFTFPLEELGEGDAADLLRYHAETLGLKELTDATPEQAKLIYDAVGGNPLATKLVIDLSRLMPMKHVLADLKRGANQTITEMYQRIYQKIWLSLSASQKALLRAMPLVGEMGGDIDYLQVISGLGDTSFWEAIRELGARSLIEIRGGAWEKRYGIHRLTMTFLQTDVNQWSGWVSGGDVNGETDGDGRS